MNITTDIKMTSDQTCLRLPICNEVKKKNFMFYLNTKMPNREQKVQLVNYPKKWKTQFKGKKIIRKLDLIQENILLQL